MPCEFVGCILLGSIGPKIHKRFRNSQWVYKLGNQSNPEILPEVLFLKVWKMYSILLFFFFFVYCFLLQWAVVHYCFIHGLWIYTESFVWVQNMWPIPKVCIKKFKLFCVLESLWFSLCRHKRQSWLFSLRITQNKKFNSLLIMLLNKCISVPFSLSFTKNDWTSVT